MPGFVLDCSITVAWFFKDEASPQLYGLQDRALREGVAVPGLWLLEVGNAFRQAEKNKRIKTDEIAVHIEALAALSVEIDAESFPALVASMNLARTHSLTVYDAAYLELAVRRGVPLATKDEALRAAAQKVGVKVLPE